MFWFILKVIMESDKMLLAVPWDKLFLLEFILTLSISYCLSDNDTERIFLFLTDDDIYLV